MSLLPYQKSHIVDETRGITPAAPPASLNIASVIVSDTGPVDRLTITSQQDLIDNYCTGSLISSNSHESLLFNAALLTRAPVDIIRVNTSDIKVGIGSLGNIFYFNEYYELLPAYTKFLIEPDSNVTIKFKVNNGNEIAYSELPGTLLGLNISIPQYVASDDSKITKLAAENISTFYFSGTNNKPEIKFEGELTNQSLMNVGTSYYKMISLKKVTGLTINGEDGSYTIDNIDMSVSGLQVNGVSYDKEDLLTLIDDVSSLNSIINIVANSDATATVAEGDGEGEDTGDGTDGEGEDVVTGEDNTSEEGKEDLPKSSCTVNIYIPISTGVTVTVPNNVGIELLEFDPYTKLYSYTLPELSEFIDAAESNYSIKINNSIYTNDSELPDETGVTKVDLLAQNFSQFKSALIDKLRESNQLIIDKDGAILIDAEAEVTVEDTYGIDLRYAYTVDQFNSHVNDTFAIVSRFPTTKDLFTYSYEYDRNLAYKPIRLTYTYNGNENEITISMDSLAMDGFGNSLYYDKYNEGSYADPYIYIAKLSDDDKGIRDLFKSVPFGSEVYPIEPSPAAIADTILKFKEYKDKQYSIVTDAGMTDTAIQNACLSLAELKFAQYPVSIPSKNGKLDKIINHLDNNIKDSFQAYYLYAPHKSNYTGNYLVEMPGSLIYIFARINAYNSTVGEFMPLFGSTKGAVTVPNPVKIFNNDEDAQKLADYNVNTIARDSASTYIRSNFTSQKVTSYLSEEQYVYITNLICHICEEYNPSIQGEINDSVLWAKIISDLGTRFTNRIISGKSPTITKFKVVCDETLNTRELIEARMLKYQVWVQYTPTVAYVLAYTYVKRLGSF